MGQLNVETLMLFLHINEMVLYIIGLPKHWKPCYGNSSTGMDVVWPLSSNVWCTMLINTSNLFPV